MARAAMKIVAMVVEGERAMVGLYVVVWISVDVKGFCEEVMAAI